MSAQEEARMESLRKGHVGVTRRDLNGLDKYTRNAFNSLTQRIEQLEKLFESMRSEKEIKEIDTDQIDLLDEEADSLIPEEAPQEEKKKRGRPSKKEAE